MPQVDKSIYQAKSRIVAGYLRDEIRKGDLRPGDRLEGVRKLADKYSVGRQVVLSAFQILSKDDILVTKPKIGAYVNPALETGHYYRIGFFVNHVSILNSLGVVDSLHKRLSSKGYHLILGTNFEEDFFVDDWIRRKRLDCVVVTGVVDDATVERLRGSVTPFVVLGNYDIAETVPQVTIDLTGIIKKRLAPVLRSLNVRNLATVAGTLEYRADRECLQGVREAIVEAGLELREEFIQTSAGDGFIEVARIMERSGDAPDAFYFHGIHVSGFIKYFSGTSVDSRPKLIVNRKFIRKVPGEIPVSYPNFGRMLADAVFKRIIIEQSDHSRERCHV